jgi:hypothetical protein
MYASVRNALGMHSVFVSRGKVKEVFTTARKFEKIVAYPLLLQMFLEYNKLSQIWSERSADGKQ